MWWRRRRCWPGASAKGSAEIASSPRSHTNRPDADDGGKAVKLHSIYLPSAYSAAKQWQVLVGQIWRHRGNDFGIENSHRVARAKGADTRDGHKMKQQQWSRPPS